MRESNEGKRLVRCVVVGRTVGRRSAFVPYTVRVTEDEYAMGDHCDIVKKWAAGDKIGDPHFFFDADGPTWLFANMFDALGPSPAANGCEAEAAASTAKPSVTVSGHGCWISIGNLMLRVADIKLARVTASSVLVETQDAEHRFEVGSDQLAKEAVFEAIAATLISSEYHNGS